MKPARIMVSNGMKGCRPLTNDEVRRIADAFAGTYALRDRALFILGVKTGFRISELLSLRVRDVMEGDQFLSHVQVARRHRKGRREGHHVPLHADARAALASWTGELRASDGVEPGTFVFRSREGSNRPISNTQAWRIIKAACRAAGVVGHVATHSMRKTFAMNVYTNPKINGDVLKTQKALGHRNIQSTLQYLAVDQDEIDQAILSS